jgi:hypothetical protein
MNWGSPEQIEFLAKMDGKISEELRLVIMGIQHVDARIAHLHWIGYYACASLTGILLTLWLR